MNKSHHCYPSRPTNRIAAMSLMLTGGLAVASPAIAPPSAARAQPGLSYRTAPARPSGYIYHNLATGERVISTEHAISTASRGAVWLWDNSVIDPCVPPAFDAENNPLTTAVFAGVHSEQAGDEQDPFAVRYWHDWLEHPGDSPLLGFSVTTFAQIPDTDSDGNGVADGVEGLDLILVFTENDDPDNSANAVAHSPFVIKSLPGSLDDGAADGVAGDGIISFQEGQQQFLFVDLWGGFGCYPPYGRGIELGDTDGIANHPDADLPGVGGVDTDADGLINSGFIIGFRQPGVSEGDGLIARFPELAGLGIENPDGPAADLTTFPNILPVGTPLTAPSERTETYIEGVGIMQQWPAPGATPQPGEGVGASDSMRLIDALGNETGPFNFGGFACDPDAQASLSSPFWVNPWAGAKISFNIPNGTPSCGPECTWSDIAEPFGILDLADIGAFVAAFQSGNTEIADIAPLPEGDGVLDLADISEFIRFFQLGCP